MQIIWPAMWYVPVIAATQEGEVEESRSEAGPGKSWRSYLENKLQQKSKNDWERGSSGRELALKPSRWKMQIIQAHPRPTESQTLEWASNLWIRRPPGDAYVAN
jgi:hypothetical protein